MEIPLTKKKKMVVVVARLVVLYGREEMGNSFQSLEPSGYQVIVCMVGYVVWVYT